MENTDYLQPGFDATSLRIADLRRIFVFHDVDFPSSAKKADLVKIFDTEIAPKSALLLGQLDNVEPHGAGIVDAPRRRTRSTSPSKPSTLKTPSTSRRSRASASPRKPSPRKQSPQRSTSDTLKVAPVTTNSNTFLGPSLEPPIAYDNPALSPSSPRKRGRTLAKKFIVPEDEGQTQFVAYNPAKASTPKEKNTTPGQKPNSSSTSKEASPFSTANVFQDGSPVVKGEHTPSKKRSAPSDGSGSDKSSKKRERKEDGNRSTSSGPSATPNRHFTPIEHFNNPDSPYNNIQQQSTVPIVIPNQFVSHQAQHTPPSQSDFFAYNPNPQDFHAQSFRAHEFRTPQSFTSPDAPPVPPPTAVRADHTFKSDQPLTVEKKKKKRQSYMADVSTLHVSEEFAKQLSDSITSSSEIKLEKKDQNLQAKKEDQLIVNEEVEEKIEKEEDEQLSKLKEEVIEELDAKEFEHLAASRGFSPIRAIKPFVFPFFKWVSIILLSSSLITYGAWWRKEKFAAGFCNSSKLARNYTYDGWSYQRVIDTIRPKCQDCPQYSYCDDETFSVICQDGYITIPNPLSFGGFLPFPPHCAPDRLRYVKIREISTAIVNTLREKNAEYVCDGGISSELEELEIFNKLNNAKSPTISNSEFAELWKEAMKEVEEKDEIKIRKVRTRARQIGETSQELQTQKYLRSTSIVKFPISCRVRADVTRLLDRYRYYISFILATILAVVGIRYYVSMKYRRAQRIRDLVLETLDRLRKQQIASDSDDKGKTQRYLALAPLRDELLSDLHSTKQRVKMWVDVERVIETNANVRSRQMEVHGEIMRIWEWVGLDQGPITGQVTTATY